MPDWIQMLVDGVRRATARELIEDLLSVLVLAVLFYLVLEVRI